MRQLIKMRPATAGTRKKGPLRQRKPGGYAEGENLRQWSRGDKGEVRRGKLGGEGRHGLSKGG